MRERPAATNIAAMPSPQILAFFAVTTLALLLVPGPSVLFILARTLEHGRRGGLTSMLGVETGALVHVRAATVGLGALVAASPAALLVLKFSGAAYLLWMGVRALRGRGHDFGAAPTADGKLFRQGLLVDALNPKTAMFFIAFLPQFVDPTGNVALQTFVLGLTFVALATLTDGTYALLAGAIAERLRTRTRHLSRAAGAAYVGLAGALAI
jgi:threonine/homoserine/homoserine lactone efflux protein